MGNIPVSWDCDLEQPQGYREIRRKARKPHRCGDCKGMIQPGEHYMYISGLWEGEPENFSRCYDCNQIRCDIKNTTGDDNCMPLNGLLNWLLDYGDLDADSPWHRWAGAFNAVATMRGSRRRIDTTEPALTPKQSPLR